MNLRLRSAIDMAPSWSCAQAVGPLSLPSIPSCLPTCCSSSAVSVRRPSCISLSSFCQSVSTMVFTKLVAFCVTFSTRDEPKPHKENPPELHQTNSEFYGVDVLGVPIRWLRCRFSAGARGMCRGDRARAHLCSTTFFSSFSALDDIFFGRSSCLFTERIG
jgi:hypothetical protein